MSCGCHMMIFFFLRWMKPDIEWGKHTATELIFQPLFVFFFEESLSFFYSDCNSLQFLHLTTIFLFLLFILLLLYWGSLNEGPSTTMNVLYGRLSPKEKEKHNYYSIIGLPTSSIVRIFFLRCQWLHLWPQLTRSLTLMIKGLQCSHSRKESFPNPSEKNPCDLAADFSTMGLQRRMGNSFYLWTCNEIHFKMLFSIFMLLDQRSMEMITISIEYQEFDSM